VTLLHALLLFATIYSEKNGTDGVPLVKAASCIQNNAGKETRNLMKST